MEAALKEELREGYYQDKYGNWRSDRRDSPDRRLQRMRSSDPLDQERRRMFRRKVDREIFEKDHKEMIKEALDDFAEEHGGHL